MLRLVLITVLLTGSAIAQESAGADPSTVPRHPLELRGLVEPEAVLAELPAELAAAQAAGNQRQLALLYLAEANACRVMADWLCQRRASANAAAAAVIAGQPQLVARGKILEGRAVIGLQDYALGEKLLAEAQTQLALAPSAEIAADVQLGLSSLSHALGKHRLAVEYAQAGLKLLEGEAAAGMEARLQRNLARAMAQLGDLDSAQTALEDGIAAAQRIDDPKLVAELHLESARLANQQGDVASQRRHAAEVLALADRLSNTQLFGQAHEALGLAAHQANDLALAQSELVAATASFRALGLERDELRAGQTLIGFMLDADSSAPALAPRLRRLFDLQDAVAQRYRAQAAGDFEARLQYARQQLEIVQLESNARLAEERTRVLDAQTRLSRWLNAISLAGVLVLTVFLILQLRAKRRLTRALSDLRRSESRAGELLRLSKGLVLLHDLDGRIDLLNPAAAQALLVPDDSSVPGNLRDHVAASDGAVLGRYLETLRRTGEASEVLRVTPPGGDSRLLRIDGRVAPGTSDRPYVIGNAADVTSEMLQAESLREQTLKDPLTGCYNRRYLAQFASEAPASSQWAVINIDLDGFKKVNDTHGHEHGDRVLRAVTEFISNRLREQDSLVRTGGDEFLILLRQATPASLAALMARLEADLALAPCRYSLGSALREHSEVLAETMVRADDRMYERRRVARGGVLNRAAPP